MDLLRIYEAADYLHMSRSTFRRRVMADPTVPKVRIGGAAVRFRESDLQAWVQRNTHREGVEG
jgi:excisionase family DNA binding protein